MQIVIVSEKLLKLYVVVVDLYACSIFYPAHSELQRGCRAPLQPTPEEGLDEGTRVSVVSSKPGLGRDGPVATQCSMLQGPRRENGAWP